MIGGFGLGPMDPVVEVPTDDERMEDILGDILDNPFKYGPEKHQMMRHISNDPNWRDLIRNKTI